MEEAGPDGGVEDTGADLDVAAGFAPFVHQFGDDIRIVFIKGIIDRLVKDFGLVLRAVVVYHVCQGCPAPCAAVAWQDSGVVDAGGATEFVNEVRQVSRVPITVKYNLQN